MSIIIESILVRTEKPHNFIIPHSLSLLWKASKRPIPMEASCKILRRSTHSFLQNYHYFTSTAASLAFPFSASILLSQALVPSPSSLLPQIYSRLRTLFDAAGFPSSQLFTILNLKVSQTITSSILTLPFTLTFLLIAKASIIQALNHHKPTFPPSFKSILSLYKPLLHTYFCNCFLILSANATAFGLMFSAFSFIERLGYSSSPSGLILFMSVTGAILFSVILANAIVICNMALALSGMEGHGGYLVILKACLLLRGRTSMALFLALPVNVALAATEALFQFRVVRPYHIAGITRPCVALEGIFIAYLYSIFIILDTVVSCMFYKSLKTGSRIGHEDKHLFRIEFPDEDEYGYMGTKELP